MDIGSLTSPVMYDFFISKLLVVHAFLHAVLAILLARGVLWSNRRWRRYFGFWACVVLAISALGGFEAAMTHTRPEFFWPLFLGRLGGTWWALAIILNHWEVIRRPLFKDTMLEFLLPAHERY